MSDDIELTDLQLAVLRVLWKRGEATSAEVHAALADRDLAITTISTILSRLESRGIVAHRAERRVFIYRAAVSEPQVRRSMLGAMLDTVFAGDATALVSQLLSAGDVSRGDIDRMKELIAGYEARRGKKHG
ncbi:MAG: BlaI/MecI/CopY family transcriptional regulator [Gemmatimonadota bacterium]